MTDHEIDRLIGEIKEMARRIGCDFVPDPRKLADFRKAQQRRREVVEQYRSALAKLQARNANAKNDDG